MIYSAKIDSNQNCIGATTIEMAKTNNLTTKGPFSCLDDPSAINLRVMCHLVFDNLQFKSLSIITICFS